MIADRADILMLTGATGFLGHYLLADLLRRSKMRVRLLVREDRQAAVARLGRLLGELGLDLQSLAQRNRVQFIQGHLPDSFDGSSLEGVDTVLHAAGQTVFTTRPNREPRRTNVDGTAALLEAAASSGVRHFLHVSTAFVCGNRSGRIAEEFSKNPPPFCNDYERSKWEAERLVLNWVNADRVATICRPSILFGDSATGRTTSANGIYLIARATEALARAANGSAFFDRHSIPLRILGRPGATCNLVPVDHAARRIASIVAHPALQGRVHHITNARPPTHADIKRWLEEYFDIGGGAFSDDCWPLDHPNDYEELFYARGNVVHDYFRDGLVFESRCHAARRPARPLIERDAFLRSLRFAHDRNWLRPRGDAPGGVRVASSEELDPAWYFERHLVDTIPRSCVARVRQLSAVEAYTIDAPLQTWICTFKGGCLVRVVRGAGSEEADFGFTITRRAFTQLVSGLRAPQQVFFEGHADITGDVERALRMVPIMAEYIAEYPAPSNGILQ